MTMPERTVLHVLPHPGGGGETYVDSLSGVGCYRFERTYLARSSKPTGIHLRIAVAALRAQLASRRYDLLHVHGEVASFLCLTALALRPSVTTLHGLHLLRRSRGVARIAAEVSLRLIVGAASRAICVAETEYDDVRAVVGPRAVGRAIVIRNGVDSVPITAAERERARAELGLSEDAVVGLWMGSLDRRKDPLTAVAAVRQLAEHRDRIVLLLAGEGPLRSEIEAQAGGSRASAIRVLGHRSDIRRVLAAADFFVMSSRREGLSFALLEAMSAGLAPVVADVPANREAVGDAGIVVRSGDVSGFTAAYRRLLDGRERLALGERARSRVNSRFRAAEMVSRTRWVYDDVLKRSDR